MKLVDVVNSTSAPGCEAPNLLLFSPKANALSDNQVLQYNLCIQAFSGPGKGNVKENLSPVAAYMVGLELVASHCILFKYMCF